MANPKAFSTANSTSKPPPPAASIGDCEFIALDTAGPYTYEFPAAGQTAWWIACWVNPRQENGPCSETVGATIPG